MLCIILWLPYPTLSLLPFHIFSPCLPPLDPLPCWSPLLCPPLDLLSCWSALFLLSLDLFFLDLSFQSFTFFLLSLILLVCFLPLVLFLFFLLFVLILQGLFPQFYSSAFALAPSLHLQYHPTTPSHIHLFYIILFLFYIYIY